MSKLQALKEMLSKEITQSKEPEAIKTFQALDAEVDKLSDLLKKDEEDYINLKKDYVDVLKMVPSQNVDVKTETKVKSVEDIYKGWKESVINV